jgi:hypothetical protein
MTRAAAVLEQLLSLDYIGLISATLIIARIVAAWSR